MILFARGAIEGKAEGQFEPVVSASRSILGLDDGMLAVTYPRDFNALPRFSSASPIDVAMGVGAAFSERALAWTHDVGRDASAPS
jgi:hypothetical protein